MLQRRFACLVALLLLLAPLSRADEDADHGELLVRLFDVGALCAGFVDYIPEAMGTVSPDMVSDEECPLFGSESYEAFLPVGRIDDLVELIKHNVDPEYWKSTVGADLTDMGDRFLLVRASRPVVTRVARYVSGLEDDVLTNVTVELRAVRAPLGAEPGGLEALLAEDGPSVTLTSVVRQRAAVRIGSLFTYVVDYDMEVAKDAGMADPLVGVANWGLSVTARTVTARETRSLRVTLDATLTVPKGVREYTIDESCPIELPNYEHVMLEAELVLTPGVWQVAPGNALDAPTGRWMFLVRATATRTVSRADDEGTLLEPSSSADTGPLVSRRFDVSDLGEALPNRRGWDMVLMPSMFTPLEPFELPEPAPLLSGRVLCSLFRDFVAPDAWTRDGTRIDVRNDWLFVTNSEEVVARAAAFLQLMRRLHLWSIDLEATLFEVPLALGRRLVSTEGESPHLLDDARRAHLAEALDDGEARRVDSALVTSLFGVRNAVFMGELFSYVQDFEVELAENVTMANPVIQRAPVGIEVDLQPQPTSTGDAVNLAYHVTRTRLAGEIRQVTSPHGPIDVPELDVFRLRGNLRVPLGRTAVVGAGSEGGRMLVLTVKPVLKPYGE